MLTCSHTTIMVIDSTTNLLLEEYRLPKSAYSSYKNAKKACLYHVNKYLKPKYKGITF